ncbi:MAG TPA: cupin domain-containing protein [Gaiellaceae bacterium]
MTDAAVPSAAEPPALDVEPPDVAILRDRRELAIVGSGGRAWAIAWPGTGSHLRAMHRLELDAGGETAALAHESEAVYFVVEGEGTVDDLHEDAERSVAAHRMVYVPRRTGYRFRASTPLVVVGGPCPPDLTLYGTGPLREAAAGEGDGPVELYDADNEGVPVPMIGKRVRLVVWPGTGADVATMNFAILEPGEQNQPHVHAESDDAIAILEGQGSIDDLTNGVTREFAAGDVVFVRRGVRHMVKADRGAWIVSAGGPCPPDFGMLKALGLL